MERLVSWVKDFMPVLSPKVISLKHGKILPGHAVLCDRHRAGRPVDWHTKFPATPDLYPQIVPYTKVALSPNAVDSMK